ncbi:carbonic anhydrase [Clostridium algoriphilum]|uniref:carbonic anhydrase n=1 Tax=Clostridium algoriphilum TaxID=198347 RepID=UPI001CF3A0B2|nr:carbonic anhydrase [Clostridium algoriphilum]MCB2295233.1 carbonic anhydrase [Clostridium algoriphilum]
MKKTLSRISIIVFMVTLSIVSGLNGSIIGMGEPVNAIKTQQVKVSELPEIKRPDASLALLKAGNERYQQNKLSQVDLSSAKRETLVNSQNPSAVVITCSDSRVPPELIFNQGLGDLFVIRVAGNVMDKIEVGSVEYAVEHLNTSLIIVMGHEHCGAVGAAVESNGKKGQGNIGAIINKIEPSIKKIKSQNLQGEELIEAVSIENINNSTRDIKKSKVIKEELKNGKIKIVEAKYMLNTGKVEWLNN